MKILFVCTGNTCRSPMAEALLKHKVPQIEVQSAGIFAGRNQRANHHTIEALQKRGITLNHQSNPVTEKLLHWADLVITMTTQHKQSLILEHPNLQEKYYTLKEYVSEADKQVWDELKKTYADFEEKRSQFIQENQHKLVNTLLEKKLNTHMQEDIRNIQLLESNLINYDISDPFGGDSETYEKTLEELEIYINLLMQKIIKGN